MPIAKIQLQDGKIARFEVPEGTTQDQVMEYVRSNQQLFTKPQSQEPIKPRVGETFTEENITRPLLRTAKSFSAAGGSVADLANQVAELPLYLGNRAYEYGKQALTGEEVKPYKPIFMGDDVAGSARKYFDEKTKGLTMNRNTLENVLEFGQELGSGFISPTAAAKGASAVGSATKSLVQKGLQKATGIKPASVKTFEELGINPTLADVSNSAPLQNFVKDIPVAGKPITNAIQKQINSISEQIQGVTSSIGGTYPQAGKELLKGAENIIEKSRIRSEQLYGAVDKFIPAETPVSMNNTFKAIQDRKVQITGSVSGGKVAGYNKFIKDIESNLAKGNQVPYDSLTALRSEVGTALQGKLEPQERAALNKIYTGLTSDIRENIIKSDLNKIGKQSALQAWEKANNSHRLRTEFIQKNIQPLLDKETPEEVYRYATSQAKIGGTKLGQIMRSLNQPQKEFIRGTIVRDLGLARKSEQSAQADIFSPTKFLSEYSVLKNNGSDKVIFTPSQREAYEKLNKVIELTKGTEKTGKLSNTMFTAIGLTGLAASSGISGLAPAVTGARISANLMANPRFVNWLANTAKYKPKELPMQINKLSAIAASQPAIREDLLEYISSIGITPNEQ